MYLCLLFSCCLRSWTSINQRQTLSTHNTNRHCRVRFYAFVGQPLSKQLYIRTCRRGPLRPLGHRVQSTSFSGSSLYCILRKHCEHSVTSFFDIPWPKGSRVMWHFPRTPREQNRQTCLANVVVRQWLCRRICWRLGWFCWYVCIFRMEVIRNLNRFIFQVQVIHLSSTLRKEMLWTETWWTSRVCMSNDMLFFFDSRSEIFLDLLEEKIRDNQTLI